MDLGAILLLLALLLGVALYLAAPLMSNQPGSTVHETQDVSSLMAERDRIITALQELDFDFKLGKIPEEDYPVQRAELLQIGANVLKRLDTLSANPSVETRKDATPELRLEEAAATQHADRQAKMTPGKTGGITDDQIESMLSARRKARKTKSAGFCPSCGKAVLTTDLFCPNCGKALR